MSANICFQEAFQGCCQGFIIVYNKCILRNWYEQHWAEENTSFWARILKKTITFCPQFNIQVQISLLESKISQPINFFISPMNFEMHLLSEVHQDFSHRLMCEKSKILFRRLAANYFPGSLSQFVSPGWFCKFVTCIQPCVFSIKKHLWLS